MYMHGEVCIRVWKYERMNFCACIRMFIRKIQTLSDALQALEMELKLCKRLQRGKSIEDM